MKEDGKIHFRVEKKHAIAAWKACKLILEEKLTGSSADDALLMETMSILAGPIDDFINKEKAREDKPKLVLH